MTKKDTILHAALKLVTKEGFYHLSMKKLAEEAQVAVGTTYLYFDSKEKLINELYLKIVADFTEMVMKGFQKQKPFKDNFFTMLGNAIDFYVKFPDCFSFIEQYALSPFLFKETQEENFLIWEPVFALIKNAKKENELKNMHVTLCAALIYGPLTSMMRMHIAGKVDFSKKALQDELSQMCWESVTGRK